MILNKTVTIVGGGLAGSEAAWQLAQHGFHVHLYEMRPVISTGAHVTSFLAELVCSNSLGSNLPDRASGLLKQELRSMDSLLIACADLCAVPAGGALAVDRDLFASLVTQKLNDHPNIEIIREECCEIPKGPSIISSGPLTSSKLTAAIVAFTGQENLFFYDAIAPIIAAESIDMNVAFQSSRYQRDAVGTGQSSDEGDYINCPMEKEEYFQFVEALIGAERIEIKGFEKEIESGVRAGIQQFFEGCLPVEILARRGRDALAFGPMRPVGLINPKTGKRPFAVVQLRQDNLARSLYNIVGFQTNLTYREQKRVFRTIPGLERADFMRYGQMHRNTFIYSPGVILPSLNASNRNDLFFAGQITGVEGYAGNIGTGLLAGVNCARLLKGKSVLVLPGTTMLGALCHYITSASQKDFQPMKANFGILPKLEFKGKKPGKRQRGQLYSDRALRDLDEYIKKM